MGEPITVERAAVSLASFPQFDTKDDFIIFKERFENQLDVCGIGESARSGILISSLSADTYKILKNLCDPELPKAKSYDDLIRLLESHFQAKISIFKERKTFYNANQTKKETVNAWYLRIKSLSINCSFGAELTSILKDRFISGLANGPVFDRIAEEQPTISLEDVVKIATTKGSNDQNITPNFIAHLVVQE